LTAIRTRNAGPCTESSQLGFVMSNGMMFISSLKSSRFKRKRKKEKEKAKKEIKASICKRDMVVGLCGLKLGIFFFGGKYLIETRGTSRYLIFTLGTK